MKLVLAVTLLVIQWLSGSAEQVNRQWTSRCSSELADTIITNIVSRRYDKAAANLKLLEGDVQGTVNCIVSTAYNHDVSNCKTMLKLLDANQDATTSLAIYDALNYDIDDSRDTNRLATMKCSLKLMKSFDGKNLDTQEVEVARVKGELHKVVRSIVQEELKDAILSKNSDLIATISADVADNYPELFGQVISRVVDEAFDRIDKHYLVMFFLEHSNDAQSMRVYSAVLNAYKRKNDFNHSDVVLYASGVKEAMDRSWNDRPTLQVGHQVSDILPSSVKRIAFGPTSDPYLTCIKNKNGEFMYSGPVYHTVSERRLVYTWTPGISVTQGWWEIERVGAVYRIANRRNASNTEYMFRSVSEVPRVGEHRFAFTWIPGGTDNDPEHQFDWTFEPSGKYVYLRNEHAKEYLYASDEFPYGDKDRRHVYIDQGQKAPGSLWEIVDCPHPGKKS